MLTMTAERWFYPLALCLMCVSSYDEYNEDCETQTLSALLGSSVLLPCSIANSSHNWVSWVQYYEDKDDMKDLVSLTSKGRIKFLDPRDGRVKAFPNQGSKGNYSICIDQLQVTDLGSYFCKQGRNCLQVLFVDEGTQSKEIKLLIYICVGVAAFILLGACSYCCIKYTSLCNAKTQDYGNNSVGASTEGASPPPEEPVRGPVDQQQQGADNNNLVYENDDHDPAYIQEDARNNCNLPGFVHYLDGIQPTQSASGIYPNLDQCNFERAESKRTKHRFHRELLSRLRQASFSRHYYVNQGELRKQQAASSQAEKQHRAGFGKNKTRENYEYKNPIYNRSADHFNQL